MSNFNRNNNSSQRRNFTNRGSDRPTMHPAVCSSCGKNCQVPFKPTGSKPIYCSECFEKNGGANKYENRNSDRSSFRERNRDREMFDAVCDKCGANCKLPFRPTSGKPILCSICFEEKTSGGNRNNQTSQYNYDKQFNELNIKLDKILKLLTSVNPKPIEKVKKEKIVAPEVKPVKVEKKKKVVNKSASKKE